MAKEQITPDRVEHPAGTPAAPTAAQPLPDGTRSATGSTYGDFAPEPALAAGTHDPSRGSELERDAMPPDADFSRPPPNAGSADTEMPAADHTASNPRRPTSADHH